MLSFVSALPNGWYRVFVGMTRHPFARHRAKCFRGPELTITASFRKESSDVILSLQLRKDQSVSYAKQWITMYVRGMFDSRPMPLYPLLRAPGSDIQTMARYKTSYDMLAIASRFSDLTWLVRHIQSCSFCESLELGECSGNRAKPDCVINRPPGQWFAVLARLSKYPGTISRVHFLL